MKYLGLLFVAAVAVVALVSGCSAKHKVDTSKLTAGFASATGDQKSEVNKAVTAINASNFAAALESLKKIASGKLSAEQKQAVQDTVVDIQVLIAENPPPDAQKLYKHIRHLYTIDPYEEFEIGMEWCLKRFWISRRLLQFRTSLSGEMARLSC